MSNPSISSVDSSATASPAAVVIKPAMSGKQMISTGIKAAFGLMAVGSVGYCAYQIYKDPDAGAVIGGYIKDNLKTAATGAALGAAMGATIAAVDAMGENKSWSEIGRSVGSKAFQFGMITGASASIAKSSRTVYDAWVVPNPDMIGM